MLHNVGAHVQEVALVLNRNECALGAVILGDLKRLCERAKRFDISLDAHIAQHKQSRADRYFPQRRIGRHEKRNTHFGFNTITNKIDHLDVQILRLNVTPNAEFGLLRLNVAVGALNGFLHCSGNTAGHLQFSSPARYRDL